MTLSRVVIPVLLLLLTLGLNGCAGSRVVLYPIEKQDITRLLKGVPYTTDRDGYFLSDLYMTEVKEAAVEAIKR
jgi:hypothetical protein